jgi:hypothetical protein
MFVLVLWKSFEKIPEFRMSENSGENYFLGFK